MSRFYFDPDFVLCESLGRSELYVCNPQFLAASRLPGALAALGLPELGDWLRHLAEALCDIDRPVRVYLDPTAADIDVWVSPGGTWREIRSNLVAAAKAGAR